MRRHLCPALLVEIYGLDGSQTIHADSNLLMFALTSDSGREMKRGGTAPAGEKRSKQIISAKNGTSSVLNDFS